jgi:hypothetical protein
MQTILGSVGRVTAGLCERVVDGVWELRCRR